MRLKILTEESFEHIYITKLKSTDAQGLEPSIAILPSLQRRIFFKTYLTSKYSALVQHHLKDIYFPKNIAIKKKMDILIERIKFALKNIFEGKLYF